MKEREPYIVSPYILIWNSDCFYLICWSHEQGETRTYRADWIPKTQDTLRDEEQPVPDDFDVARYTWEVFRMNDDEELEEVTFLYANEVMKGVLGKIGMYFTVKKEDLEPLRTKVKVCTFSTFCSWVLQWGAKVRIDGLADAVTEYRKIAMF